jgi:hypothetical protein
VYAFTELAGPGPYTIDASQASGGPTYHTLNADWISSVSGFLVSSPAGINESSKSAMFLAGTTVTITADSGHAVQNNSWTGACAGSGSTCTLTNLAADMTFSAIVIEKGGTGPIYNVTKATYHLTLADAMLNAGTGDYLKISTEYNAAGGTTAGGTASLVTLSGPWTTDHSTRATGSVGVLTISTVGIIADGLTI